MGYVNVYPFPALKSKAELKRKIVAGENVDFIIAGQSTHVGSWQLKDNPGMILSVTNHPKRSWFATVEYDKAKDKVKVS